MDKQYTLSQIKALWTIYKTAHGWRVLRAGKWHFYTNRPDTTDGATRSEMIKVSDHYSFPKYLEVFHG